MSGFRLELDGYPRYLLRTGSFVFKTDHIGRLESAIFDPLRILCIPLSEGGNTGGGVVVDASAERLTELEYGEDDGYRLFSPDRRNLMEFRLDRVTDGEGLELRFTRKREVELPEKRRVFVFELPRGFSFDGESIEVAGDDVDLQLISPHELYICSPGIPEMVRVRISGDYVRIE
jgi:hypothetical protein